MSMRPLDIEQKVNLIQANSYSRSSSSGSSSSSNGRFFRGEEKGGESGDSKTRPGIPSVMSFPHFKSLRNYFPSKLRRRADHSQSVGNNLYSLGNDVSPVGCPRNRTIDEMVTNRRLFTSYFYRQVVLFFLGATVLICVEVRDLYNTIGRASITGCCGDGELEDTCSLQICAEKGLFVCDEVSDPLNVVEDSVAFRFLWHEPWWWALMGMFVAMITTIIIMSIEAFHIQHYCYTLLSYKIYVCMGSSLTKFGTTSLVIMILVVELVYDVLKANLVYSFRESLHRVDRCGESFDIVVGRIGGASLDMVSIVSNFVGPFFLFLIIWRMVVGQVFEIVQDPYSSLGISNIFIGLKNDNPSHVLTGFTKISHHKLEGLFREFAQKHKRRSMTNAWRGCGPHVEFVDERKMDGLVQFVKREGRRRRYFLTLHSNKVADPVSGRAVDVESGDGSGIASSSSRHHPFYIAGEKISSSIRSPATLTRGDSSASNSSSASGPWV